MTNSVSDVQTKDKNNGSRGETLKKISAVLADLNTKAQLEVAIPTLEFLKAIEGKTPEDVEKIHAQENLIKNMESDLYKSKLEDIFCDKFSSLSDYHLDKYLDTLLFEEAIAEVNLQTSVALVEVQEELLSGELSEITVH